MYLVPDQDPAVVAKVLEEYLHRNAPWGVHVDVVAGRCEAPGRITLEGGRTEAARTVFREVFGINAVEIDCGGSIPVVVEFVNRNPGALVLVTAVTDLNLRICGIDESPDLSDFAKVVLVEILLLNSLAG